MMSAIALGAGTVSLASAAVPPPLPALAEQPAVWFAVIDGQKSGPMTEAAFNRHLADGSIAADTLVWHDGMTNWVKASETITFKARQVEARLRHPASPVGRSDNRFAAIAMR